MKKTGTVVAAALAIWVLLISGMALAATPSQVQYGNPVSTSTTTTATSTATTTTTMTPPATTTSSSGGTTSGGGTLPFTGLNLGLLVGGALILLGSGVVLRRVSRKD